jgi:alanine dehydrogenase
VMNVLIADQRAVTELLPMGECIELMERTLVSLAEGDAVLPLRSSMLLPGTNNRMLLMPSALAPLQALGAKIITIFPANHGGPYDAHQGVVLVFDERTGVLQAIVDATAVTALRTAGVSAVATRALARPDPTELALIGAGTQGATHLEALLLVRPIRRVRVYDRDPGRAASFAERESRRREVPVDVAGSAREAVEGAGIVCTLTTSREPVLRGEWLAAGCHLNAVGAYTPETRELDGEAVRRSRLFADRRESVLHEAGELVIPVRQGLVGEDHLQGELGEVLTGRIPGRRHPEEITLFKSLGLAIEDLAAAHHVLQRAVSHGGATFVDIGGRHFGSD